MARTFFILFFCATVLNVMQLFRTHRTYQEYDELLDQWIDQDKKIVRLEWENKKLKSILNNGTIPIPKVNEDPFKEPEEFEL